MVDKRLKKNTILALLNINERTMKIRSILIVKSLSVVLNKNEHICATNYRIVSR
jgi:hypothetical protein